LQYPNSDVADVLHFYEVLTGKRLVLDNAVQGKVNIFIAEPIPRDEAIKLIEMNLALNGFALIPVEGNIMEVVGLGKNPRVAPVPIISDEADIPAGDQTISFLFKLNYADPVELQQVLIQYLGGGHTYASIFALQKSGSLLVTESSGVLRKLARIVAQVDVPPAEVVSEFIKLERADAEKVVDMLKDVFEKNPQAGGGVYPGGVNPRGARVPVPVPQQVQAENDIGGLTALSEESVVIGKIKLAADVRTNRIHVITRPVNIPFIRKLIAEFDANVEFAKPVTRPLRYIAAGDVLPVLVQALTEPGTQAGDTGAQGGAAGQQQQQQGQQRRNSNTASTTNPASSDSSNSSGSNLNISEELSTQPVDTTPKAVTIGNAKIIADQRANAIIVLGNREVVVKVEKILDEMDVKAPQVVLSTVIGELTLNNNEEFGIDYFGRLNPHVAGTTNFTGIPPFAGGGTATTTGSPPVTTTTGGSVFNPGLKSSFTQLATTAAGGANVYLGAGTALAAVVHALDSTGRFRTISRPTIFTTNNKKAIIASGTEIPVPVNTLQSAVGTGILGNGIAQQSNIQFKKVALQLEVVPLINSEKEVTLDILQKLDSLAGSTTVDGNQIPNIATRYIKTTVSAPNGSTIILGGLIMENKTRSQNGIPILSRIPVIGGLFRDTKKTKDRTELIVLMRPEVTLTKLDLYRMRQKIEDRTHFGPELEQDDCPDCPKLGDGKQIPGDAKQILLPPDLPPEK
jgi:type II secretion system protein D